MDLEENEAPDAERRFELRAVKDISKEEEVTIFYPTDLSNVLPMAPLVVLRETIREDYGFDCKCPVCSGELPNQFDIMRKMADIIVANDIGSRDKDKMTLSDWTREAIAFGAIVELAKPVYMERPEVKMNSLLLLAEAARESGKQALRDKALDGMKELAEKTRLEVFKHIEMEMLMNQTTIKENLNK